MRNISRRLSILFVLVFSSFATGFASAGDPPVLVDVDVVRSGSTVTITGSVVDEDPDSVLVTVEIGGGLAPAIPVNVVGGDFSLQLEVGVLAEFAAITAIDNEGLKDTETIEVPF